MRAESEWEFCSVSERLGIIKVRTRTTGRGHVRAESESTFCTVLERLGIIKVRTRTTGRGHVRAESEWTFCTVLGLPRHHESQDADHREGPCASGVGMDVLHGFGSASAS